MVKLNNFSKSFALSLLSASSALAAFSNSTSCEAQTVTSIVSVYGPSFTGVIDPIHTTPALENSWGAKSGPIFTVFVPQYKYDLTSLDLYLMDADGITYNSDSYKLFSGNGDSFVWPGNIYETSPSGLVFDGKTQDPYLKITIIGDIDESSPAFIAAFNLELDVVPSAGLEKREILTFELTASVANPDYTAPTTSTTPTTPSTNPPTDVTTTPTTGPTNAPTDATTESTTTNGAPTNAPTGNETGADAGSNKTGSNGTGAEENTVTTGTSTNQDDSTSSRTTTNTVTVGKTITEVITSCSDNACTDVTRTAVGTLIETTISDIVTSFTTYCPIVEISSTVTISNVVTVIVTDCLIIDEAATVPVTVTHGETTETKTFTLTNTQHVKPSIKPTDQTTVKPTEKPTEKPNGKPTEKPNGRPTEQTVASVPLTLSYHTSQSTSNGVETTKVSIYDAAAAAPANQGLLAGSIAGILGLVLMI
ncbi:hypothetical protein CANINC_003091 [Pichia inconspicua]|uniref:Flo11 domain-containing protein n=1 Tax=Pichia inconspicua TaxID=52247 RepID=A0A4T0WZJ4_9ASCO|nr:hypothetical protein CANINC_003091 [[Candida] inconspicua]